MRLGTKVQVGELFAVIGRERGHVDQRLHTLGAREPDDRACVSMCRQDNRPGARSMLRLSASTSSASSVSGSGAATALMPWGASPVMTRAQLDQVRPAAVGQHNTHSVHRNFVLLI